MAPGGARRTSLRRVVALLVLLAACGGGGDEPTTSLADGTHVGSVVELDPTEFALTFDARDEEDEAVRVVLDEDLRVRLLRSGVPRAVPFEVWRAGFEPDDRTFFGTSRSTYELTVEDGRVVAIDEVATP